MRYRVLIPTLVLILSGCGGEAAAGSSPTEDTRSPLAHGTWLVLNNKSSLVYIAFREDGTFVASYNSALKKPIDSGTWVLDETELSLHSGPNSRYCPSRSGRYQIAFSDDQSRVSLTEPGVDECSGRRGNFGPEWRRIEEG